MAKTKKQAEKGPHRYKLVAGIHQDKDGLHEAKNPSTAIVESVRDLAKQFPEKFRRLDGTDDLDNLRRAPASGVTDAANLENMSDEQLSQLARDNEVDLSGASDRETAIELIRNALEGEAAVNEDNA